MLAGYSFEPQGLAVGNRANNQLRSVDVQVAEVGLRLKLFVLLQGAKVHLAVQTSRVKVTRDSDAEHIRAMAQGRYHARALLIRTTEWYLVLSRRVVP